MKQYVIITDWRTGHWKQDLGSLHEVLLPLDYHFLRSFIIIIIIIQHFPFIIIMGCHYHSKYHYIAHYKWALCGIWENTNKWNLFWTTIMIFIWDIGCTTHLGVICAGRKVLASGNAARMGTPSVWPHCGSYTSRSRCQGVKWKLSKPSY